MKYPFLIAWMRVYLKGLNSVAWYHCASTGLFLSAINVFADWCVRVGPTCRMNDSPLWLTSSTTSPCLFTVISVSVNVAIQPSSNSFRMDISATDCRWGKMCAMLAPVDSKGVRLSSAFWVACMRLPYGSITCSLCEVFTLFLHGLSTLM